MYCERFRYGRAPRTIWLLAFVWLWLLPAVARPAVPDVTLPDLNGKPHRVSEYIGKGRWTVVTVWSADCPICRREMYHMTFLHDEHKDRDLRVLGLSIDGSANRDKARDFAEEQTLNFPSLLGTPGDATRLSGHRLAGTPTYYFFAPDGSFLTQRVGALTQAQAEQLLAALKQAH
ncbi:MAG: peroxiredoxin family protein [Sulfurifustaceae bacterium]